MDNRLAAWGGYTLKIDLIDKEEDIVLMLKYSNHGDEYLITKNKNGDCYEYGMYYNLKYYWKDNPDIIRPVDLYCEDDEHAAMSNERRRFWHYTLYEKKYRGPNDWWGHEEMIKTDLTEYAQMLFDEVIEYQEDMFNKGIYYREGDYREDCLKFLKLNGIATDENIAIVEKTHWNSKQNGCDGICEIRRMNPDGRIYFDEDFNSIHIEYCIYKGKERDISKLKTRVEDYDEWGISTYSISLKQFK